jgi:anti-sigma regulatory factor (Ser/Thr protein kinase)
VLDLSMHILDVAENSITAGARLVHIEVEEDLQGDRLVIEIGDDGHGMDADMVRRAADPFVTTRRERKVGFGLPLLSEAARRTGGEISIRSDPDGGTRIRAVFGYRHIDRQPLGDLGKTLMVLIVGHPDVEFFYRHRRGRRTYSFSSPEVKERLRSRSMTSPEGIVLLRALLKERLPAGSPGRVASA